MYHTTKTLRPLTHYAVAKIHAVQAEYSAFETLHEVDGLVDTARELNVAYVSYGPLGHGWLVEEFPYNSPEEFKEGDYRRESKASSPLSIAPCCSVLIFAVPIQSPSSKGENFYTNKKISEGFKELAKRKGCTITQVALAWVAAQGMIAIPGTTKPSRLEQNFSSRDVELTEEELKQMRATIDQLKPQGDRYNEEAAKAIGN